MDPNWRSRAACQGYPLFWFFPKTQWAADKALNICDRCPVLLECLQAATREEKSIKDDKVDHFNSAVSGIRGGLRAVERKRLMKKASTDIQRL